MLIIELGEALKKSIYSSSKKYRGQKGQIKAINLVKKKLHANFIMFLVFKMSW